MGVVCGEFRFELLGKRIAIACRLLCGNKSAGAERLEDVILISFVDVKRREQHKSIMVYVGLNNDE